MTVKALALMPRRPDLSRAEFRRYYETRHAPLALRYLRFRKYVRNHVQSTPDVGFDCVSEFWPERLDATFALMRGKVGERLREDERAFTDQPRIVSATCEEIELVGDPRADDETGARKVAVLLRTALDAAAFADSLRAWVVARSVPARRVAVDSLLGVPHAAFPCDAIVWLYGLDADADLEMPDGITIVGRAPTEADETSAAVLAVAGSETLA